MLNYSYENYPNIISSCDPINITIRDCYDNEIVVEKYKLPTCENPICNCRKFYVMENNNVTNSDNFICVKGHNSINSNKYNKCECVPGKTGYYCNESIEYDIKYNLYITFYNNYIIINEIFTKGIINILIQEG